MAKTTVFAPQKQKAAWSGLCRPCSLKSSVDPLDPLHSGRSEQQNSAFGKKVFCFDPLELFLVLKLEFIKKKFIIFTFKFKKLIKVLQISLPDTLKWTVVGEGRGRVRIS